jgi:hypothetical protein
MSAVLKWGTLGSVVVMVLAAVIGWLIAGMPGLWGGILGVAIPVAFFSITVIVALVTLRVRPGVFGAAILGSWIAKLVLLIVVLAALSRADFYSRGVFFVAFVIGTIGYLVTEAVIVVKTRVPFIEPGDPAA